jgi:hypothetical protein
MFAVRCTRNLLSRSSSLELRTPVPPTTILGDWYANILFVRPEHLALCISEKSLLPVVTTAKDLKNLPNRVARGAREVLLAIGVPEAQVQAELAEMKEGYLAPTANRRVLGSLNDFMFHLEYRLHSQPELTLLEQALKLAAIPCGAIEYAFPREAALACFASAKAIHAAKSVA